MSRSKQRIINPEKGYCILFNALQHSDMLPTFAQANIGTPLQKSRWKPNHPELVDRENRRIDTLDDLLSLMQTGNAGRIADSLVVVGTNPPISWKQFFIRESRKEALERFKDLYNRVGKIKGGDPIPCAMVFEASETKTMGLVRYAAASSPKGRRPYCDVWIKGQGLYLDGKNIDFELHLSYLKDSKTNLVIRKGDLILVTGMAERGYAASSRETVRVHVDHEKAMRHVTREELTTPPPPPKPIEPSTEVPDGLLHLHGE